MTSQDPNMKRAWNEVEKIKDETKRNDRQTKAYQAMAIIVVAIGYLLVELFV